MPKNTILHIKPIDVLKDDIEVLKSEIYRLQEEVKKINIKLKAKESIDKDNSVNKGGWWWGS
jgi:hypothetical protein